MRETFSNLKLLINRFDVIFAHNQSKHITHEYELSSYKIKAPKTYQQVQADLFDLSSLYEGKKSEMGSEG